MKKLYLFTDGSVHVQSKIGYGACLLVSEDELAAGNLKHRVQTKRFENTSSTKLELQMLLWALSEIKTAAKKIIVYTDSQTIARLPERRNRLEKSNFRSKKGELLKNVDLYQEFYKIIDGIEYEIVQVQGHQPSRQKNSVERIFTFVDKASRKALRKEMEDLK
ncbi:hypothetical protein OU798_23475 [Prolixibacteraceae bacterium Z1-6]|uniref:RNase H type-1 domain-containing protein n=1 Tax=Draconibacterium aestuarii TaxID=2998507 RepID=A0A9X3J988_9BACT|nr:hypothetical protein [Prolixibacteraceae bacterium Z1-6]